MERRIDGLFGKVGAERGTTAENRVITVFERRIKERDCPEWLIGCKQAKEEENRRGIEKAKKHHPRVPVVCIPPGSSNDYLFRECLGIVERERIKYLQERE